VNQFPDLMKPIQSAIIGGTRMHESGVSLETFFVKTKFGRVELNIAKYKDN